MPCHYHRKWWGWFALKSSCNGDNIKPYDIPYKIKVIMNGMHMHANLVAMQFKCNDMRCHGMRTSGCTIVPWQQGDRSHHHKSKRASLFVCQNNLSFLISVCWYSRSWFYLGIVLCNSNALISRWCIITLNNKKKQEKNQTNSSWDLKHCHKQTTINARRYILKSVENFMALDLWRYRVEILKRFDASLGIRTKQINIFISRIIAILRWHDRSSDLSTGQGHLLSSFTI